jgi:hypothetical protein
MAKPKGLKLKDFFGGHRRKAHLLRWEHLVNAAGEPRIKLTLKLPLLNEPLVALHGAIGDQFALMAREDSKVPSAKVDVYLEGMTLEVFSTEKIRHKAALSTGVTMLKFSLQAEGEEEKKTVDLHFVAYLPASEQWRDWAWTHRGADFWMAAEYSQTELDFSEESEEDEGNEEEEEEQAAAPVPSDPPARGSNKPPMPKANGKNGPANLKQFHEEEVAAGRATQ